MHVGLTGTEGARNLALWSRGRADRSHLIRRQVRVATMFAFRLATLIDHVLHVVGLRAKEEVIDSDTTSHVTARQESGRSPTAMPRDAPGKYGQCPTFSN
jgi:hypothetical protein